jgi:hypothetical protein
MVTAETTSTTRLFERIAMFFFYLNEPVAVCASARQLVGMGGSPVPSGGSHQELVRNCVLDWREPTLQTRDLTEQWWARPG